jgi:hypothetical protein
VLTAWNGGDKINATLSSNVTIDNRGVITRTYTSLKAAAEENSQSRVFGGVSITFHMSGYSMRRLCQGLS